jgi:hypothetical protein
MAAELGVCQTHFRQGKSYLEGGENASHKKIFREREFSRKSEEMLAETAKCGIPYRHRTLLLLVK